MDLYTFNLKNYTFIQKGVKVITGLTNLNIKDIFKKVKAAEIVGATYLDIAANPDIVVLVKSWTKLPVCVSSIDQIALYKCIMTGAEVVEIGNFDVFYDKHILFSDKQVLDLAYETKLLLYKAKICVTIPHKILLSEQIQVAIKLKNLGIDILQTEGISTKHISFFSKYQIDKKKSQIFNSAHKASSALSSSYTMSKFVDLPIIASSGIDSLSAPIAISYGASGIGLCSCLNQFQNIYDIANYIDQIITSLYKYNKASIIDLQSKKSLKFNNVQDMVTKVKIS